MKKTIVILIAAVVAITAVFAACSSGKDDAGASGTAIHVLTREDGSGTRGAFVELFGIEEKDENGEKVDKTIQTAEITNSTSVMLTTVNGDVNAIGYVSLGSLSDDVKALQIDGADATAENIENGTYKVARPFNIAYKDGLSEAGRDFMNYIMSDEGQAIVSENGYIPGEASGAFATNGASGSVTVGGSSSVYPLMEKLAEAYQKVNTSVTVNVQQSDSTVGMSSAQSGVYDIGMASRALEQSELDGGLTGVTIATDGIAVIVNQENALNGLTSDQVKGIYTGALTTWEELSADAQK